MGVIVRSYKNNIMRIVCNHKIVEDTREDIVKEERFSNQIIEAIQDYSTVVGSDASVKRRYIGGY